jgi:tripartite-type tricarboxylate transporter receptor subunit TctC
MSDPTMKSFNQSQGADAMGSTPDELAALHKREYDKWAAVVKAAGIKPE